MFDLSGKVAIVTGGSYGFGPMFADALAQAGADIVLTARSVDLLEEQAEAVRQSTGKRVVAVAGDISVEADVINVVQSALAEFGHVDVLVNNAGISDMRGLPSEQFDTETFRQILEVDLLGLFIMSREVGRHMLARGSGSIINIASILGDGGGEFVTPAYYAAKGGVIQLSKQLAVEWADRGVRVNVISPNYFITEMTRPILEGIGMADWIRSRTPARRLGELDDLRGPIVFLASDESSYVTGVNLGVDGGFGASRGAWQMRPGHHYWNTANGQPMIGEAYEGLVPLPREDWKAGLPGVHYPMPEAQ